MNSECCICFEIVRSNNDIQKPFVTRCGHLFHENCIKNCLKNTSKGKCPQCNQPVIESHLIRLYVNEPENLVRSKDETIEHLKSQLNELNQKAQLQYDLIGSLNRQIVLEKNTMCRSAFDQVRRCDSCQSKATDWPSLRPPNDAPHTYVAPAKLLVQNTADDRVTQRRYAFTNDTHVNPFYNFATGSTSQITYRSGNTFRDMSPPAAASAFTFGNIHETCSIPTMWSGKLTSDNNLTSAQSQTTNHFVFGSNPRSSINFDRMFSSFLPKDSSENKTSNSFAPTQTGTTSQSSPVSESTFSRNVRKRNLNSKSFLNKWRVKPIADVSNVSSTLNASAGIFGEDEEEPLTATTSKHDTVVPGMHVAVSNAAEAVNNDNPF